jgi:lipid A 3-O-deacylase
MTFRRLCIFLTVPCLLGVTAAAAQPVQNDPTHTLTIQLENDVLARDSDRYYTAGQRIGYTSPTGALPDGLATWSRSTFGDGPQRYSLDLSQLIFTPRLTNEANPPRTDRPYAAILLATASLIQDTENTRTVLALGLGVTGPNALGQTVQNGFHDLIRAGDAAGWHTQGPSQPVVQLTADRTWRLELVGLDLGPLGRLEADVLPSATLSAGMYRVYAQAGGLVRIGEGLRSDFGPSRNRPGLTGTDAYAQTRPISWYVFAGMDGQAVAWDETLDGEPWTNSRHVRRLPLVSELEFGFTVMIGGIRLTAAHVLQTREFATQKYDVFQFSSGSISVKFCSGRSRDLLDRDHVPGQCRPPDVAHFIAVEAARPVHRGAVVPDHQVVDPPLVCVNEPVLGRELGQIAQEHAGLGDGPAHDGAGVRRQEQRFAPGDRMRAHQALADRPEGHAFLRREVGEADRLAGERQRVFADQVLHLGLRACVQRVIGGAHVGELRVGAPRGNDPARQ